LRLAGRTLGVSPRGHTGRGGIEPDEGWTWPVSIPPCSTGYFDHDWRQAP